MPKYEPEEWNKEGDKAKGIKGTAGPSNCYNYALDKVSTGEAGRKLHPGEQNNHTLKKPYDCDDVTDGAVADGVDRITADNPCKPPCWRIALFIAPPGDQTGAAGDFHWFREDEPGSWSHKMDGHDATNLHKNKKIEDPEKVDIAPYTFCRYLCVCKNKLKVRVALAPGAKPPETYAMALPAQDAVRVTAVLHSGAANPQFDIPFRHTAALRARLEDLHPVRAGPPARLGYRGFVLENPWRLPALPWVVKVEAGIVTTWSGSGRRRRYADDRGLEKWLLARTRGHPEAEAIAAAARESRRRRRRG